MTDHANFGALNTAELAALKTSDLRQYDFNSVKDTLSDRIKSLMDQEGAFSLDSKGELIVVNPPKKRDNCIYRFFKGLFNSQYKEQQRQFDKVTALQRNASFNEVLKTALTKSIAEKSSSAAPPPGAQENEQKVSSMLSDLFSWKSNNVTLKDIKLMTIAQEGSSGKAGIPIKGESLTPAEFIHKYAAHLKTANNDLHMTHAILSRITANPEAFACINAQEKASALNTLLSQPRTRGIQDKINQILQDIMAEINDRMSAFAEKALTSGKDVTETARKLAEIYDSLCAPASGNQKTDRAFMTKIFGENGALSKAGNLRQAANPQYYTEKDSNFRYSGAMIKLKEQLPDLNLTDKQLGEIVRGLSGNYQKDISDSTIKQFADIKNMLPKMEGTRILQVFDHLSDHGSKEITPEALKQYAGIFKAQHSLLVSIKELQSSNPLERISGIHKLTQLFQDVTGITDKNEMSGHMKEFFSHVGHALPLSCSVFPKELVNTSVTPEVLTALKGLKTALKDSLDSMSETMTPALKSKLELKFSFVNSFMDEIRDHMSTGNDHTAIIAPDDQPAPQMKTAAERLIALEALNEDESFNKELDKAADEMKMNGPQSRNLARMVMRDLTLCALVDNTEYLNDLKGNYKKVIEDVASKMNNNQMLKNMLSVDAITAEHLNKVITNSVLTKEAVNNHYAAELHSRLKAVTPTTVHDVFLRDTLGESLKLGDNDFSWGPNEEQRKDNAEKVFNQMVPEKFRGFVSSFVMQGGMPNLMSMNYMGMDAKENLIENQQNCLHPMIPDLSTLFKHNISSSFSCTNRVSKRDDNTLEVKTVVTLGCTLTGQDFKGMINNLKHLTGSGTYAEYGMQTFEMVHVINLEAGVHDVKGTVKDPKNPKNYIEVDIPNVPVDMKLESITVKAPQSKSNIDF
ncbi:hypothetical protein [Succinimonas sp.]|uniref:hypothetical protein n=1 Tax=Succinimonas sp. TaxID=1936151 RepID=UPI0038670CA3